MSKKFEQIVVYSKGDGFYTISEEASKSVGNPSRFVVLAVPPLEDSDSYIKALIECTCNALKDFTEKCPLELQSGSTCKTENGMHESQVILLRQIGATVQYLVNCCSWHTGDLEDYDRNAITERLVYIQRLLDMWAARR